MRHVSTICAQILGWHKGHVRIETLLNESVIYSVNFSTTFNAFARKPFPTGWFGSGRQILDNIDAEAGRRYYFAI